jgi:hypothetical protein
MRNYLNLAIYFAASVLASGTLVYGQADTATIVGTVQDSSGAVIPSGMVTVTATDTGAKTVVRTDSAGNYVVTPLRIGNYSVSVEAQGFKTETQSGVVLQVQDRLRVNFTMQVGSVTDTVNVQEATPVIQTETSALGDVVGSQQITDMPLNGRDYTQLATLTTGVIKITENGGGINGSTTATNGNAGGAFAVNGTRGNLNNFMLDGIDNNSNDPSSRAPTRFTERRSSSCGIRRWTQQVSSLRRINPSHLSARTSSAARWEAPSSEIKRSSSWIIKEHASELPRPTFPRFRPQPRSAGISAQS